MAEGGGRQGVCRDRTGKWGTEVSQKGDHSAGAQRGVHGERWNTQSQINLNVNKKRFRRKQEKTEKLKGKY